MYAVTLDAYFTPHLQHVLENVFFFFLFLLLLLHLHGALFYAYVSKGTLQYLCRLLTFPYFPWLMLPHSHMWEPYIQMIQSSMQVVIKDISV